ncbi:uncharacterized protein LOC136088408 [Hydra vulgaris]|uniref:Uncharacterized protein LOC136088408 n=1 Tax=Hydra vulgaris TaxID=6087 RepID=A0ABM4D1Q5_HYDVU
MTTSEVFNFTEIPVIENGIERCEDSEYEPIVGTNLNFGDIKIIVPEQNLFSLPSKAYLLFEGQLVKLADGSAYADADPVALTNNGIMQLFSKITYQLGNQDIEAIYNPVQATIMLGLLNYSNDFQLAQELNQLWYKDIASTAVAADNTGFATRQQYIIKSPTTNGTFSFCVPLRHIFGFCDDYDKVIYGLKHTIILTRQSDNPAIFRLAAAAAGKVNLTKISLFIPSVKPSFEEEKKIDSEIKRKVVAPLSFRMRQCYYNRYYNCSTSYCICKQSEKLKSATVQLQVKAFFNPTVPANTQAYAIVISDKMMKLVSDGNKFDVK